MIGGDTPVGLGGKQSSGIGRVGGGGGKSTGKPAGGKGGGRAGRAGGKRGAGINPNNALLNPNQTLQGKSLLGAATALTNAQTTGPLTELARQIALNNRQGAGTEKLTAGYFNQLGKYAKNANTTEANISNDLNSQLAGIANQTGAMIGGFGQQAQASPGLQGLAGAGLDGGATAQLAQELARQQGYATQDAGTFRSSGATQGANYRGLAAANAGAYALGGQERLGQIAQATRLAEEPLNAKEAALRATRGSLLSSNLGKLRQQEIANAFTAKGLNLRGKALAQALQISNNSIGAANSRSAAQIAAENARSAATIGAENSRAAASRRAAAQRQQSSLNARKGSSGSSGSSVLKTPTGVRALTTNEQNRIFAEIAKAQQLIVNGQSQKLSEAQIRANLTDGQNPSKVSYDPAVVDAAYALQGYGYLTPKQISELNNIGVIVGSHYRRGNVPGSVGGGLSRTGSL